MAARSTLWLLAAALLIPQTRAEASACTASHLSGSVVVVTGRVLSFNSSTLVVETRSGRPMAVDLSQVAATGRLHALQTNMDVTVVASEGPGSGLVAQSIVRAKPAQATWQPDCVSGSGSATR